MAKTLIDFQNKLIDIYLIKTIEKSQEWDYKKNKIVYSISINKQLPESQISTKFDFHFEDEKFRDEQYQELRDKLEDIEYLIIL